MRPLVNDAPLLIYPQLAMAIGLEEAVLLQQLHFRLHHQGVTRDGEIWYSQSYEHYLPKRILRRFMDQPSSLHLVNLNR